MPSRTHSSGFCRAGAKRTVSSVRPATSKERVRRSADLVALQEKRAQTHKPSQRATVGARNAPTQAGEAQRPLQHARADQQQSRSRSRDRQVGPGAQPPPQQSCASQQPARSRFVEKLDEVAQQPQILSILFPQKNNFWRVSHDCIEVESVLAYRWCRSQRGFERRRQIVERFPARAFLPVGFPYATDFLLPARHSHSVFERRRGSRICGDMIFR